MDTETEVKEEVCWLDDAEIKQELHDTSDMKEGMDTSDDAKDHGEVIPKKRPRMIEIPNEEVKWEDLKNINTQDYLDIGETVISKQDRAISEQDRTTPGPSSKGVIVPDGDLSDEGEVMSLPLGIIETVEPRSSLFTFRETRLAPSHLSTDVFEASSPRSAQSPNMFGLEDVNAGSDEDENEAVETLPGNEAEDFHALIPDGISQQLIRRIQEVDTVDDNAISALLSPDDVTFDWQADASAFKGEREVFTGVSGPTCPLEELKLPVDCFLKFWDAEIIDLIVKETNSYAERELLKAGILKDHSRLKKWQPITREELLVFFAVLLVQANYPLSVEKKYFYNTFRYAEMPLFRTMMPYDRFILVKKFLHFTSAEVPSSATREQAKVHKIQPILDHLAIKFQSLYMLGQEIALDESLLKWLGRLSYAKKIATKAAGEDIKSHELCESRTGYLWSFKIYAGKSSERDHSDEALGLTAKVVYDLAKPLFGKGHTLVMDNIYNSPLLSRCLKRNATDVFGTLRINREFVPQPLKDTIKTNMRVGEVRSSQCEDLTILLWRGSNLVAMTSTYHAVVHGVQEKHGVTKCRPKVIIDYNSVMGGVDKKDKLLAGFPMERVRNAVWYKTLFRRMLNVSILNAMVMHRWALGHTTGGKEISHRDFREELVLGLLARFQVPNPRNTITTMTGVPLSHRKSHEITRPILIGCHFPVKCENKRSRCVLCYAKKKEKRTNLQCDVCLTPLCIECFKPYHTDPNQ